MCYFVYKHTSPSGKVYIGVTRQVPEKRWQNGLGYRKQKRFYRAIQKYGWENIAHEVVADNLSGEEADELEKQLIHEYKSSDKRFGYNIELGGNFSKAVSNETRERMRAVMTTDEARARTREINKKRWSDPEAHKKMSARFSGKNNPMYGRHVSDEEREKRRLRMIGKPLPPVMYGADNPMYGKHHTEETKAKIAESRRGSKNFRARKVRCIETDTVYDCIRDAFRCTGIRYDSISKVCIGKGQTAGGYHWEYADSEVEQ